MKPFISIVIPVYNGEPFIKELYDRLYKTLSELCEKFEIILVNDKSPDNSWELIEAIAEKDAHVIGICLSKNFGQHYAIRAGLESARGDWIVVMDCDLQDVPEEIPRLYETACSGYDSVFAARHQRQDHFFKRSSSKLFYKLLSYLTDTEQNSEIANFGIYNKKVIMTVISMSECLQYFPVMVKWAGFNSTTLNVTHGAREYGESSYTIKKLCILASNIMISFSNKILYKILKLGILISFISCIAAFYTFIRAFLTKIPVTGWASLIISIWFLSGIIIFILGIIGIYIGKIFDETKNRPLYTIQKSINLKN